MGRRTRNLVVGASLVGMVLGTPAVAAADSGTAPANFQTQSSMIQRITKAVQLTKDEPVPTRAFSGPVMLADPSNPRIIVAATAELRTRVCYLIRSTNAGKTWHILPSLPALPGYPFCTNTSGGITQSPIAWGRNSTLYYALSGYNNADGGDTGHANTSIMLAKSTNLGSSWSTVLVQNNRGLTGTNIAHSAPVASVSVDTSGPQDVVYVAWRESHPNATSGTLAATSWAMVAVSRNGGHTFSAPQNINLQSKLTFTDSAGTVHTYFEGAPFVAAGKNGTVVAMSSEALFPSALPTGTPTLPHPMLIAVSHDYGQTWNFQALGPASFAVRAPAISWSPLGGPNGTFLAAYQSSPNQSAGEGDIWFQRSTDNGATWSSPVHLNDEPQADLGLSFLPQMNVAPNGRIDVIFYDFRLNHGFSPDVYYTWSNDDGVTWSHNVRVTDQSINFSLGVSANSDLRQPPGVASANDYAAFGWADTRLGNQTTQTQDVFGDVAQFHTLPAASSSTPAVLAAIFGGILAAGIVLLVVLASRRRKEQGPTTGRVEEPEPATT
ncbi:MAG: sialidase family protein [Acidimicrobiales bacterium]